MSVIASLRVRCCFELGPVVGIPRTSNFGRGLETFSVQFGSVSSIETVRDWDETFNTRTWICFSRIRVILTTHFNLNDQSRGRCCNQDGRRRRQRSLFPSWASHIIIITMLCLRRRIILKSKKIAFMELCSMMHLPWEARHSRWVGAHTTPPREIVQNPWMDPKGSFESSLEREAGSKAIDRNVFQVFCLQESMRVSMWITSHPSPQKKIIYAKCMWVEGSVSQLYGMTFGN